MIFEKDRTMKALRKYENEIEKLPDSIKQGSILLMGPQGVGKTTLAKMLERDQGLKYVTLDNKDEEQEIYKYEEKFNDPENFKAIRITSSLSKLKAPSVVEFEASDSMFYNDELIDELKKVMKNFNNTFLLLPTESEFETIQILGARLESMKIQKNYIHKYTTETLNFLRTRSSYRFANEKIYENSMNQNQVEMLISQIAKKEPKIQKYIDYKER